MYQKPCHNVTYACKRNTKKQKQKKEKKSWEKKRVEGWLHPDSHPLLEWREVEPPSRGVGGGGTPQQRGRLAQPPPNRRGGSCGHPSAPLFISFHLSFYLQANMA